jgi:orotate phosphoribosyltransferase
MVEGAFLAQMVAEELDAKFYFAEQWAATQDDDLYPVGYRIPKALRHDARDKRTAVVDDVINAGSAVRGAVADLQACGARLIVIGALLVLGSHAAAFATGVGVSLENLAYLPNTLWEPAACPLCASGVPLESSEQSSVRPLKDT